MGGDPFSDSAFLVKELERMNEAVRLQEVPPKTPASTANKPADRQ